MLREEIVVKYQAVALERVQRLELEWTKLVANPDDVDASAVVHREAHNLKGDSRMVGFTDVDLVCHKLEDLLGIAQERNYRISDDLELVITTAFRFIAMLVKKKAGGLGGIDLPGFIHQIDGVVARAGRPPSQRTRTITATIPRVEGERGRDELTAATRTKLAATAFGLFLEHHTTTTDSKAVLAGWTSLRDLLALPPLVTLPTILLKHKAGVEELARSLGKAIALELALDPIRTTVTIAHALDVIVMHLVRNALDHGLETTDVRLSKGSPAEGRLSIRCRMEHDEIKLEVEDDGAGINFPRVRSRAVAIGLLEPTAQATNEELAALLFEPGFTTRKVATEVSGRGMGLDAVDAAVRSIGGQISVQSETGAGTTWTITVPAPPRRIPVHAFSVPGIALRFCVGTDWEMNVTPWGEHAHDLVDELGLVPRVVPSRVALQFTRGGQVLHVSAVGAPAVAEAQKIMSVSASSLCEVVALEGAEGILIQPEKLIGTPGTVALLDDSEICRELVRCSLEPLGVGVTLFEAAEALVGSLAIAQPDLVLLDLSYRTVDYVELVRRIRAAAPSCIVYLYSDRPPTDLARHNTTNGTDGFISKAAGVDQFVVKVTRLLKRRR